MAQVELQDPELDAADPHTRLLLLAEHWKREAMLRARDADRYRWLRHNSGYTIRCDLFGEVGPHEHKDGDLDALIDAQMVPNA